MDWLEEGFTSAGCLSGDEARRCSMDRTAASSSFNWKPSRFRYDTSSSLEFCADSGGEITAPGGMWPSLIGGGDCRMLPLVSVCFDLGLRAGEGALGALLLDGLRRCLRTYAVDE